MAIDLTEQVENRNGDICVIRNIEVRNKLTGEMATVPFSNFIEAYSEYVDPKDLEIERLNKIIQELKNAKTSTGKRKRLSEEEWLEIEELIRKGERNIDIASVYGINDSGVSKRRIEMRKRGEKV